MSSLALSVDSLGKRYRLGTRAEPYDTARQAIMRSLSAPWRRLRHIGAPGLGEGQIWALKDVSFQLEQGEVLGIIGRNGAGKSTLLKILSGITEPSEGHARVRGRVGSLLEIGTGFHPELTGRENIFLNGAVLGMARSDIKRRFDEIVEFSGVERHLETPVKFYSSGMYMRLAFAVAAHLEPDILIVDEVLAVGDAEFQKKCLGKMSSVAGEGRTVLFVSHNLVAVEGLCHRVLLLEMGRVDCDALPREALARYAGSNEQARSSVDLTEAAGRLRDMRPVLRRLDLRDDAGKLTFSVECGQSLTAELWYEHDQELIAPAFAILVETLHGLPLFHLPSEVTGAVGARAGRCGRAVCRIDSLRLQPGRYKMRAGCRAGVEQLDLIEDAAYFDIEPSDYYGTGRLPDPSNGLMLGDASWALEELDDNPLRRNFSQHPQPTAQRDA